MLPKRSLPLLLSLALLPGCWDDKEKKEAATPTQPIPDITPEERFVHVETGESTVLPTEPAHPSSETK